MAGKASGEGCQLVPVYLPVYASKYGDVMDCSVGLAIRSNCGTLDLKVPCSATELLAQALPRVYSKTALSSTLRTYSSVGSGAVR